MASTTWDSFNAILSAQVESLRTKELLWNFRALQGPSVPKAKVNGRELLMLCSNNYLGLTTHPKLKKAAIEAVEKYGAGSGSVRPIAGNMDLHEILEEKIAEYKHCDGAVYFPTGFTANSGTIPQLIGEGDLVVSDELNHGSIIDGVRLTKAVRSVYKHADTKDLERILEETSTKNYQKILVITDGVFSMDGDITPLPEIARLAEKFGVFTFVDDAHGDGVLGRNGRGIVDHFNLHRRVNVEMGTFSKAFGVIGGYVSGSRELKEFVMNKARTFLLTGSPAPAVAAACIAALEVVDEEPQIIQRLWDNTRYFKTGLKNLGFDIGNSQTPITPVMLGESNLAQRFSFELFEQGVFALPIVFPMVAQGKARIRTIMNASLTMNDLDTALKVFETVGRKLQII